MTMMKKPYFGMTGGMASTSEGEMNRADFNSVAHLLGGMAT